jgi:hypothetical protein
MPRSSWSRAALAASLSLMAPSLAHAHAVCGDRVFPPTLVLDDPGFNDEASLPTIQYTPLRAGGGNSSGSLTSYGYEWDKTVFPNFGFAINGDYIVQHGGSGNQSGWDNTTVTVKGELPLRGFVDGAPECIEDHEFMASFGVIRLFAGTGSGSLARNGVITSVSSTAPTIYLGKGMGDLPIDYLRPFAVTGEFGYQFSDSHNTVPDQWNYAASLQYSIPYMQQHVKALDIPDFFTHLIPLVEFVYSRPQHGGPTFGTISPGIFYEEQAWQVGAEALIPGSGATRRAQGTGFIVQFHVFLDDVFPNSLGKPLFSW